MYQLTLIRGAELAEGVKAQTRLPEPLSRFAIGRDPANPWPIPDRTRAISACHCEIVATPAGPALRDLSTNGTFVNGASVRLQGEHLLDDGDVFEMGPYAVRVAGPRRAQAVAPSQSQVLSAAASVAPPRNPGVLDTAPLRGGDPAAMLAAAAAGGAAPWGLTEILRNAPPTDDANLDLTQIRTAPKAGATPPPRLTEVGATRPGPPANPAVAPAAPGAEAAASIDALAQAAVQALRQLLDQQAQVRRQLGSRSQALPTLRSLAALRVPATPQAALLALRAPGSDGAATLQVAAEELAAHHRRLLAAFNGAAQRLAADISPQALQATLGPAASDAQKARLWDLYAGIWQTLGAADGKSWEQCLLDTALQHLAAAYDDITPPS